MLTLNEMITKLTAIRDEKNAGNAVVHICIPEYPFLPVTSVDFDGDTYSGVPIIESAQLNTLIDRLLPEG